MSQISNAFMECVEFNAFYLQVQTTETIWQYLSEVMVASVYNDDPSTGSTFYLLGKARLRQKRTDRGMVNSQPDVHI